MVTQLYILVVTLCLINNRGSAQNDYDEYQNLTAITRPGCPDKCPGGSTVRIPFPFGINSNCAFDETFNITCNYSFSPPRPFLTGIGVEVLNISLDRATIVVNDSRITSINQTWSRDSSNFSKTYKVAAQIDWVIKGTCLRVNDEIGNTSYACSTNAYCSSYWHGFNCYCNRNNYPIFEGNPYLPNGCQDINECERRGCAGEEDTCVNTIGGYTCIRKKNKLPLIGIGVGASLGGILLFVGSWWMFKAIKKLKKNKIKKNNFKRNGGLLLKQQLASGEDGTVEKTKLFNSDELEKATDHYNEDRILGKGGQGTVYKGMLTDGRIVAIKMSKIVDEEYLEQFINEVVILSQINHRNIVKLHGCCLETEVPLLVYEFISNGTLSQYLYDQNDDFPLSWDLRLRIATEVASALSYLHYAASQPIYHRDMKSTNILLDDKYKAKVADFGTSRSVAIDQTHLTTRVLGTFGYLDPEYFQTGQFTEKSDVYSFGVVLVELLTGEKPICLTRSEEPISLTSYFITAVEENTLFDIIDARIRNECQNEEILAFANLAKSCLSLDVRKRPTMKEVASGLDDIRTSAIKTSKVELDYEEVEHSKDHFSGPLRSNSSSTFSSLHIDVLLDTHPLLRRK